MWIIIHETTDFETPTTGHDRLVQSKDYDPEKPVIMYPFRLLCDDEIVALGLCSDSSSFAPKDDCGEGMWGANGIEYFEGGQWKPL